MFTSHFLSEQKPIPVDLNLDLLLVDMELELLLLVLELEPIGYLYHIQCHSIEKVISKNFWKLIDSYHGLKWMLINLNRSGLEWVLMNEKSMLSQMSVHEFKIILIITLANDNKLKRVCSKAKSKTYIQSGSAIISWRKFLFSQDLLDEKLILN